MSEEKKEEVFGNNIVNPEVKDAEVKEPDIKEQNNSEHADLGTLNSDKGSVVSSVPSIHEATNIEGIIKKESNKDSKTNNSESEALSFPKLFIKQDDYTEIKVDIIFDKENGEVLSVCDAGSLKTDHFEVLAKKTYTFKFKQVTYDDMQRYRKAASFYSPQSEELVINKILLRQLFLTNNLKDTDIPDKDGNKFEIKIDEETGIMSSETIEELYTTAPALLDVVMTLFERTILILFDASN